MRPQRLVLIVLAAMTIQSAAGLLLDPYRDIEWIALGWLGNDGVTLFLACPLLAAALTGTRLNAPRWQLARLGLLGYALYNYAFYMLGAALNVVFPIYIALFVATILALIAELPERRVSALAASYSTSTPVRLLGGYLAVVASGLTIAWLMMWMLHVFANRPAPGSPEVFRLVAALDLGFMVPALSIGGVLLWRRKPWGYVLGCIAGIQAALYLFVLVVNSTFAIHSGITQWPGELPIWIPLCAATSTCVLVLLRYVSADHNTANAV